MRMLLEYRDEGGKLNWLAQTCPEVGDSEACARRAARGGAVACHIHGGVMDHLVAHGRAGEVAGAIALIRSLGMKAGIAGHVPAVFEWAEKHLDVDYYMCCYYNPTPRTNDPEHVHGAVEEYREEDRRAMTDLIQTLSRPVDPLQDPGRGPERPGGGVRHLRRADAAAGSRLHRHLQRGRPGDARDGRPALRKALPGAGRRAERRPRAEVPAGASIG